MMQRKPRWFIMRRDVPEEHLVVAADGNDDEYKLSCKIYTLGHIRLLSRKEGQALFISLQPINGAVSRSVDQGSIQLLNIASSCAESIVHEIEQSTKGESWDMNSRRIAAGSVSILDFSNAAIIQLASLNLTIYNEPVVLEAS
jgi:hypothetical protein